MATFNDIIRLPNRTPAPGLAISAGQTAGLPVAVPTSRFVWILRILCVVALGVSGYLAYSSFNQSEVFGCGGGGVFDCGHVLNSKWSKIFGLPVSVPALAMYATMLGALGFAFVAAPEDSLSWTRQSRIIWSLITFGALSAGMAALWFTSLQVFAVGHLCKYCLAAHSCGLAVAGMVLWKRPVGTKQTALLGLASAVSISVLIGGQVMAEEPQTFKIETFPPAQSQDTLPSIAQEDSFAAPGVDDVDLFAPPTEDEVFAPPGENEVFAPPSEDDGLFAPPAIDDNVFTAPDTAPTPTEVEIFGGPAVEYDVQPTKDETPVAFCQIVSSQSESSTVPQSSTVVQQGTVVEGTVIQQGTVVQQGIVIQQGTTPQGTTVQDGTQTTPKPAVVAKPVAPPKPVRRIISVSGGRTRLDVRHWPLLGKPTAKYIFVEMFDYTCSHCRATHHAVDQAMKQYKGELAVISLPVPLNSACNNTVRQNNPTHANACELARIAVAAWRVNPSKFTQFHCWMFASPTSRSVDEARNYAANLVGPEKFYTELSKKYAGQYIAKHVELYRRANSGAVPKLLFPRTTMVGQVSSSVDLVNMVEKELVQPK